MKRKGQETLFGLIMVFVMIMVFWGMSPVLYTAVSTYSFFGAGDKVIVQMFPMMMAIGILLSIIMYIMYGRTQRV